MSKLFIEDSTLTAIGDAIREKTGKTDLIAPGSMPAEIKAIVSGGGDGDCNGLHLPDDAFLISGNANYMFQYNKWNWFVRDFGHMIRTDGITMASYMLSNCSWEEIPFTLNFDNSIPSATNYLLSNNSNLVKCPEIHNLCVNDLSCMFSYCYVLKEFPKQFGADWDWNKYQASNQYTGKASNMFNACYSLRTIPEIFTTQNMNKQLSNTSSSYYNGFSHCYSLEKLQLPVYTHTSWTANAFYNTFQNCARLKELTFAVQEDGTPYVAPWKSQIIDLSDVGYEEALTAYVPAFTDDTKITNTSDRYSYCEASNPPNEGFEKDGWAADVRWSVFGRKAAKKLFATLPDTTAAGGGNTIKLKERAAIGCGDGSNSDAIITLTDEEIAVAAAKGWTVTLVS
jgi:hypothetical protein